MIWYSAKTYKPQPDIPCFVIGEGKFTDNPCALGLAYYDAETEVWYDDVFNEQLPSAFIETWTYVPREIVYSIKREC